MQMLLLQALNESILLLRQQIKVTFMVRESREQTKQGISTAELFTIKTIGNTPHFVNELIFLTVCSMDLTCFLLNQFDTSQLQCCSINT